MQTFATKYGLGQRGVARQFVAGSTVEDAIAEARRIALTGHAQGLEYIGAPVRTMAEADAATRTCIAIVQAIVAASVGRSLIVRLTDLGLTVDRATCVDNLRRVLDSAAAKDVFVWIEMEDSRYTQVTIDIFHTLWQQGYRNSGIALQAYLPRSVDDAKRMNSLGARVRLVRGHYRESRRVAYRTRSQIDRAFVVLLELLFSEGTRPAIATEDSALIESARTCARSCGIAGDAYEFHLPYGAQSALLSELRSAGAAVRVLIPFGPGWFPYVMRRLGERPSNLGLALRALATSR